MERVNIGLVGAGFAGKFHSECYGEVPGMDVHLQGVYSRTAERAEELAGKSGAKVYRSFEELLMDPDIHAVDICTPANTHEPLTIAAAKARKHVIVEKPLTG